jgi:hypothetical protein
MLGYAVYFVWRCLFGSLCLEEKLVTEAHACATGGAAASTLFLFLCELLLLYSSCFFFGKRNLSNSID